MKIRIAPSLLSLFSVSLAMQVATGEVPSSSIIVNKEHQNQIAWVGVNEGQKVQVQLKNGELIENSWKLMPTGDAYASFRFETDGEGTSLFMKARDDGKVETTADETEFGTKFFLFDAGVESKNGFTGYRIVTQYEQFLRSQGTAGGNGENLLTTNSAVDAAVWYFLTTSQPAPLDVSTEDFFYSLGTVDSGDQIIPLPVITEDPSQLPVYPAVFAQCMSSNDLDPAATRIKKDPVFPLTKTSVFLEEEKSADTEINHASEDFGFMAIRTGDYFDEHDGRFIGMVGSVDDADTEWSTWSATPTEVVKTPVVIMNSFTYNDRTPGNMRVKEVTSSGDGSGLSFKYKFEAIYAPYQDKTHAPESASFMMFDEGTYSAGSGKLFVGTVTASTGYEADVNFGTTFPCDPVILAQPQTVVGSLRSRSRAALLTRIRLDSDDADFDGKKGFKLSLQKPQGSGGADVEEKVGIVAFCRA